MTKSTIVHKIASTLLIFLIRIYQHAISPFTPAACRHVPTCSEYSVQAVKQHGPVKGGWMAMKRIGRCNPWGTSGYDPVPQVFIRKINISKFMTKQQKILKTDLLKQHIHFLLVGMFIFGFISCNFQSGSKTENTRPKVVVSIAPQKFIVDKIAGDLVDVMVMIPPGTSPHVYDPTPRQMVEVGKSNLCFFIGNLGFETAWFTSIKDAYPQLTLVNLNDDLELIAGDEVDHGDHTHAGFNPHTWMSPRNVTIMAERIQEELSEKYPSLSHHFKENLSAFHKELNQIDLEIKNHLSDLPHRTFMIFHPSLTYFAKDYGMKEISIEFEGKEPAPIQLKHSIDNARQAGVKVIFIQKEFDADNAKIIAKEIGGRVVQIDPLAESWDKNLMKIVLEIKNSFNEIGETTIH